MINIPANHYPETSYFFLLQLIVIVAVKISKKGCQGHRKSQ